MARGVNKVILIGNIGRDPEVRSLSSGAQVTSTSIATNESWKDKQSGERKERTEWHNVVFFGKLAAIAGEYLKKGAMVYVEGSLRTRKWQDKEGHDRYSTEIVVQQMQMLGGRGGAQNQSQPTGASGASASVPAPETAAPTDYDDDLPF